MRSTVAKMLASKTVITQYIFAYPHRVDKAKTTTPLPDAELHSSLQLDMAPTWWPLALATFTR